MIVPSELNQLVDLVAYTYSQNTTGTVSAMVAETIPGVWARVKQRGGATNTMEAQQISTAQYEVVIRYLPQFTENWQIRWDGLTFKIDQIQYDNPAYRRYLIVSCSTLIKQENWS